MKNSSLFIFTQVAYLCLVDFFFYSLLSSSSKRLVIYDRPEGGGASNSFFVCLFPTFLKNPPQR